MHCAFGFGLQLVLNEIFLFYFNGCLDSLVLSCLILLCHVLSVVFLVYIYNILTIGFDTLCFMHLVLGCSLNIFLANFLIGQVMGYLGWVGLTQKKKIELGHGLTHFWFRVKKRGSS